MTPATADTAAGSGTTRTRRAGGRLARRYARASGALLLALGVAGFLSGGDRLFGVLNADPAENTMHLTAGALLLLAGLLHRDGIVVAITVVAVSSALLLVGVVGLFVPTMFGLVPGGLSVADDVLHLVLGAAGIASAGFSRASEPRSESGVP